MSERLDSAIDLLRKDVLECRMQGRLFLENLESELAAAQQRITELEGDIATARILWAERMQEADNLKVQRDRLAEALRAWLRTYGSTFEVGYLHSEGRECPCMRCKSEGVLQDIPLLGPTVPW